MVRARANMACSWLDSFQPSHSTSKLRNTRPKTHGSGTMACINLRARGRELLNLISTGKVLSYCR